jgi:hypothetical protein
MGCFVIEEYHSIAPLLGVLQEHPLILPIDGVDLSIRKLDVDGLGLEPPAPSAIRHSCEYPAYQPSGESYS